LKLHRCTQSGIGRVCEAAALAPALQPAFDRRCGGERRVERSLSTLTSELVSSLRGHLFGGWFGAGLLATRELNNDAVVAGAPLLALSHPALPMVIVAGGRRG